MAGVIIHPDKQWRAINGYLWQLADKYVKGKRPFDFYFHAMELHHGTKNFHRDTYSKEIRWEILASLAEIPRLFDLPVVWGYSRRELHEPGGPRRTPRGETPVAAAAALAFSLAATGAEAWMDVAAGSEEVAQLVMENDEGSRRLIKRVHRMISDPKLRPTMLQSVGEDALVKRLIYPILFEEKTESSSLQLADVCAFLIKRNLMGSAESEQFYRIIKDNIVNHCQITGDKVQVEILSR